MIILKGKVTTSRTNHEYFCIFNYKVTFKQNLQRHVKCLRKIQSVTRNNSVWYSSVSATYWETGNRFAVGAYFFLFITASILSERLSFAKNIYRGRRGRNLKLTTRFQLESKLKHREHRSVPSVIEKSNFFGQAGSTFFVLERSRVRISIAASGTAVMTDFVCGFPLRQENLVIVPRSRPLPLLSIHFSVCYSILILQLNTTQRELLKASLNKPSKNINVTSCSLRDVRGMFFRNVGKLHGVTFQKTALPFVIAVRISNRMSKTKWETPWNLVVTNVSGEPHASIFRV
jgi:hypothetical protein